MATYFTTEELSKSTTAIKLGINNSPPSDIEARLELLIEQLLDPIREIWGAPLIVNSGYRSPELNDAIGGVVTSQHTKGEAADITTESVDDNQQLFEMIAGSELEFDQLIDESGYSWLHVSYRRGRNRRQILHL